MKKHWQLLSVYVRTFHAFLTSLRKNKKVNAISIRILVQYFYIILPFDSLIPTNKTNACNLAYIYLISNC